MRHTSGSEAENNLAQEIRWIGLPDPVREHRFTPLRRWRFDFAWPEYSVAVEVEGATWTAGRHTRGAGFEADCEKYNVAIVGGWRILRVTPNQIRSGEAIMWLEQLLK